MKGLFLGLAVLILSTTVGHAADHTIVGVVAGMEPGMIQVVADSGDTRCVAVDADTEYMKWLIEKSWAQDLHVDLAFLRVGERVRIQLRRDDPEAAARKVWIVVADRSEG